MNKIFKKYNPHPEKKNIGDCQTRAFTKLTGQPYLEIRKNLNIIKRGIGAKNYFDTAVVELAAIEFGSYKSKDIKSKMTFEKFALKNKGKWLLVSEEHVAACVNGYVYDNWNSLDEKLIKVYCF